MKHPLLLIIVLLSFGLFGQDAKKIAVNEMVEQKIISPTNAKPATDVKTTAVQQGEAENALKLSANHLKIGGHSEVISLSSPEEKRLVTIAESEQTADSYKALADYYLLNNRADKATKAFERAIMKSPKDANLFVGFALAQLYTGEHETAMVMLQHALELDTNMPAAQKLKQYFDEKNKIKKEAVH